MDKVTRTDAEWRKQLTPEEGYDVPTDQRWCVNSVSLHLSSAGS
jgi:hypothetical protein